jgi:hypothetical protein
MTSSDTAFGWAHDPATQTFRKTLPPDLADLEQRGWRQVARFLPVPELLERVDEGPRQILVYEDVFERGHCQQLLADAITAADTDPARVRDVVQLTDDICDSWVSTIDLTGRLAALSDCTPALYAHRLRPAGRLDAWYGTQQPHIIATSHGTYELHLSAILDRLRADLASDSRWPTAITQGDPTEPNIAEPLRWLDFEHAGRNTIAGEVANLLWYLLGLGGWLVPAYQPLTYAATLRIRGLGAVPPEVTYLRTCGDQTEVEFTYRARPGRRAALDVLTRRIHADLGGLLAPMGVDADVALSPWLAVRVLGVIRLTRLCDADQAVCLATLAHILDPSITLDELAVTTSPDLLPTA